MTDSEAIGALVFALLIAIGVGLVTSSVGWALISFPVAAILLVKL